MWNQEKADDLIPKHMQGGLKRWIELGIEPGSFLPPNPTRYALMKDDKYNRMDQKLQEIHRLVTALRWELCEDIDHCRCDSIKTDKSNGECAMHAGQERTDE